MDRISAALRTIAQPMRWVKLTLRGAIWPFSSFRRASSVATSTSRKLVAVGTPRLATMFCASRAAGPLIGVAPAGMGERPASSSSAVVPFVGGGGAATGSNPPAPESNSTRQSGSTLVGSLRYRSYRSATYPALTRFSSSSASAPVVDSGSDISRSRIRRRVGRCLPAPIFRSAARTHAVRDADRPIFRLGACSEGAARGTSGAFVAEIPWPCRRGGVPASRRRPGACWPMFRAFQHQNAVHRRGHAPWPPIYR